MKNKGLMALGAIAIIIVLAVYLIFSITLGSWNPSEWEFSEQPQAGGEEPDKPNESTGKGLKVAMLEDGQALYGGEKYEMPESVTFIRVKEDAGTHITTSGIIMTPRTRQAGEWVWTVKFLNAGSEWAADKNVNEYIELTAAEGEDNADGVNVNIIKPFGEPIVLKAALKDSEVLDECRLEYLSSATMQNIQHVSAFYDGVTFTTDIAYGEGTVKGECEFKSARIGFDSEFEDRLIKELSYVKLGGYTFNKTKAWTADSWKSAGDGNADTYEFCADYELDYFMFVKNFYTLTESQRFAVVKSWGTAPTLLDIELTYRYKGAAVASIIDSDVAGNSIESFVELWQQPGTTLPDEQEPGEQEPGEESYKISILKDGDANSLTPGITFNCQKRAKRFEIVKLEIVITDPNYTVTGIEMLCNTSAAVETEIKRIGENIYQFQMPKDDIDIFVYFKFELQSPEELPDTQEPNPAHYWQIGYGTLSDGGVGEEITLNCPPHAKAGETVSFTVTAADPEAFISGVMLSAADNPDWTDDDDYYIEPDGQGVYKFQMPACDIRLTIYLINIKDV